MQVTVLHDVTNKMVQSIALMYRRGNKANEQCSEQQFHKFIAVTYTPLLYEISGAMFLVLVGLTTGQQIKYRYVYRLNFKIDYTAISIIKYNSNQ